MGYSRAKTRFVVQRTCEAMVDGAILKTHQVYFWTLTTADNLSDKAEAERRLKPVKDLIHRKGGSMAGVWQLQKRGAWHAHFLTNVYIDVNEFRPWAVARGWGPQMKVKHVKNVFRWDGQRWQPDYDGVKRVVRYICRYIGRSMDAENFGPGTRTFFASAKARCGTTRFSWMPDENPSTYLYYWGRHLFQTLWGRWPTWRETAFVIRLGVEDTDWLSYDPWWMPFSPSAPGLPSG